MILELGVGVLVFNGSYFGEVYRYLGEVDEEFEEVLVRVWLLWRYILFGDFVVWDWNREGLVLVSFVFWALD